MKQKKRYSQPIISYEPFVVNGSVSADCTFEMTSADPYNCYYEDTWGPDFRIFAALGVCNLLLQDDELEKLCYHVPIESMSIFGS